MVTGNGDYIKPTKYIKYICRYLQGINGYLTSIVMPVTTKDNIFDIFPLTLFFKPVGPLYGIIMPT